MKVENDEYFVENYLKALKKANNEFSGWTDSDELAIIKQDYLLIKEKNDRYLKSLTFLKWYVERDLDFYNNILECYVGKQKTKKLLAEETIRVLNRILEQIKKELNICVDGQLSTEYKYKNFKEVHDGFNITAL